MQTWEMNRKRLRRYSGKHTIHRGPAPLLAHNTSSSSNNTNSTNTNTNSKHNDNSNT